MADQLKRGDYAQPGPNDLRAPCPVLNSLANHGHLPRDGRGVTKTELTAALKTIGLGFDATMFLVNTTFEIHSDDETSKAHLGLPDPGQVNEKGERVFNLDQVGRPHGPEHDVSLTRQDRELGDCINIDPSLLQNFLSSSADGQYFTLTDFANYRKKRYEEQKAANPNLKFTPDHHRVACIEVEAFQGLFGTGFTYAVPKNYVTAVFAEQRLPYKEGWKPRLIPLLLPEILVLVQILSKAAWPFGK